MNKDEKNTGVVDSPIVLNVKSSKDHAVSLALAKLKWSELVVPELAVTHTAGGQTSKATAEKARSLLSASRWDVAWLDLLDERWFDAVQAGRRINQFPAMETLTRKKNLAAHLNSMRKLAPKHYGFHPISYLLPHEFGLLADAFKRDSDASAAHTLAADHTQPTSTEGTTGSAAVAEAKTTTTTPSATRRTFIVKPDNLARGEGIYLVQSLGDIKREQHAIVQQYVHNPLLVDGRKFDMRIYVLITSVSPLRVYLFDEGLARFASQAYAQPSSENLGCKFMHLTNYSVNKSKAAESSLCESGEDSAKQGGKWSLNALRTRLREMGHDVDAMWRRVSDLVVKVVVSAQPLLSHAYRTHFADDLNGGCCFQLLGFDVLLDETLTPWLCEVNRNPSLACGTALDLQLKTELISQLLRIVNPQPYLAAHTDYKTGKRDKRRLKADEYKEWQTTTKAKALAERLSYEDQAAASAASEKCRFRRVFPPEKDAVDGAASASVYDECLAAAAQAQTARTSRPVARSSASASARVSAAKDKARKPDRVTEHGKTTAPSSSADAVTVG